MILAVGEGVLISDIPQSRTGLGHPDIICPQHSIAYSTHKLVDHS
jgi:hypothetical protein